MTIFEILTIRSQWENYVINYKLESYSGTIDNLKYFLENGRKDNRFRANFDKAYKIAETIVDYYGSLESLGKKLER